MEQPYGGKYRKLQRVGAGKYGVIFKVEDKDKKQFIAKHVSLDTIQKNKALQQLQILKQLKHPYIVEYVDNFIEDNQLIIIMQYCGEKDLAYHIELMKGKGEHFNQHLVINWILQLILALKNIHSKKILHRDIKPQNIFIDKNMNLKVGDFGISKQLNQSQQAKTVIGTPFYLAPEICSQDKYTSKADIWSLGCVIYEICALDKPFDSSKGLFQLLEQIKSAKIKQIPSIYSQDLRKLVSKMLTRDPQKRPSTTNLLQDPLIVQLMISNSSQINLKKQYPKTISKPAITDSFIDKQTNLVNQQLKKFQNQVSQKLNNLKKKSTTKTEIQKYYQQVKKKMKDIQKAVKFAFKQLKDKGKDDNIKKQDKIQSSLNSNSQQQSQSVQDLTIQSIVIGDKQQQQKQKNTNKLSNIQNNISMSVQSIIINQKQLNEENNDMDITLKSQFTKTVQKSNELKLQKTITNKLQLLQQTINKNPQILMDQTFMNCTLSLSGGFNSFKKVINNQQDSISFQLTKKQINNQLDNSIKKKSSPRKKQEIIMIQDYQDDFQNYQEIKNQNRAQQMSSIYSIYQQTLQELNNNDSMTGTDAMRRKYPLNLSLIRQQSNQGGSILTQNGDETL